MGFDVEARFGEAEFMRHVDVLLQRIEVRHQVGIAVIVVLAEDPAEPFGRLLGQLRSDLGRRIVVLGIELPVQNT